MCTVSPRSTECNPLHLLRIIRCANTIGTYIVASCIYILVKQGGLAAPKRKKLHRIHLLNSLNIRNILVRVHVLSRYRYFSCHFLALRTKINRWSGIINGVRDKVNTQPVALFFIHMSFRWTLALKSETLLYYLLGGNIQTIIDIHVGRTVLWHLYLCDAYSPIEYLWDRPLQLYTSKQNVHKSLDNSETNLLANKWVYEY